MADDEKKTDAASADDQATLPAPVRVSVDAIKSAFPDLEPNHKEGLWAEVRVPVDQWPSVARHLQEKVGFNYLSCVSAVDQGDDGFEVVYHLISIPDNRKLAVKVSAQGGREEPTVPSVTNVWKTADWHEREAWDLMGIRFTGHPDLRRILMREDWEGHPLRKDYVDDRAPRERQRKEDWERRSMRRTGTA